MRQRLTTVHLDYETFKEKLEAAVTDPSRISIRADITLDRDGLDALIEDLQALRMVMEP